MALCAKCGTQMDDGVKFCPSCGEPAKGMTAPPPNLSASSVPPVPGTGMVKKYLGFLDTSVLFKKPVSCLFAIGSLCIPVYFLLQIIQNKIFETDSAKLIVACILLLLVLLFAGVFGALIWWYRRIARNEGFKLYENFRHFVQTLGEWTATVLAIVVFFGTLILIIFAGDNYYEVPLPIPGATATVAISGLVGAFLIIIATKIFLLLLDPIIWLAGQIWGLIKRAAKYLFRLVVKLSGTIEQNAPVWIGVTWLLSILVVICGLALGFKASEDSGGLFIIGVALIVALGFAYMAFLVLKRKDRETGQ